MNHKKIRRLMREHDLQPKMRRRFVATTDSDHDGPIFPNLAKEMHSALGYLSPQQFEDQHIRQTGKTAA